MGAKRPSDVGRLSSAKSLVILTTRTQPAVLIFSEDLWS